MLPLILSFVEEYYSAEEREELEKYFKLPEKNLKKDVLVKAGGLKKMIECFFKHNKDQYKKFKKSIKEPEAEK